MLILSSKGAVKMKIIAFTTGLLLILITCQGQIEIKNSVKSSSKIECALYSFDGLKFAYANSEKKIVIVNSDSFKQIAIIDDMKPLPVKMAFSKSGKYLAVVGDDKKIYIWNTTSLQLFCVFKEHKDRINAIKFGANDKFLASASNDQTIIIWNLETKSIEKTLLGHAGSVISLDISNDGATLISSAMDKTIKIWDVFSGKTSKSIPVTNAVKKLRFNEKTNIIAGFGDNKHVNIWDGYSGRRLNTFFIHKKNITDIDFSSDGSYILSGGQDSLIIITEVNTGLIKFKSLNQGSAIKIVQFNPTGKFLLSVNEGSNDIQFWNIEELHIKEALISDYSAQKSAKSPVIELVEPGSDEVYESSINILANIKSESNLRSIDLYLNGEPFLSKDRSVLMLESAENGIYKFNEALVLNEGENNFQLRTKNDAGETESEIRKIFYIRLPEKPLSWISPAQPKLETHIQNFELKALISPSADRQSISIFINNQKKSIELMPANGGILVKKVHLVEGENKIKIVLANTKFEKVAEERILVYSEPLKPQIEWIAPVADEITYISSAQIQAQINSETNLNNIEILINGTKVFTKTGVRNSWLNFDRQIKLFPGQNTITIIASNETGETISAPRIISFVTPEKTSISWVTPGSDSIVYNALITVYACIQSKTDVTKVEIYNNNKPLFTELNLTNESTGECKVLLDKKINLLLGQNKLKIVAENVGGITESEIRTVIFTEPMLAEINWIEPGVLQTTVSEPTSSIRACIKSNTPVKAYTVMLNKKIFLNETSPQPKQGECSYTIDLTVPLENGNNEVILRALNMSGNVMSEPLNIEYKTANPYRFALIFGNEDYSSYQSGLDSESDVDFAINDAREFKLACITYLNIKEENILYFENARFMDMKRGLGRMSTIIKSTGGKAELFVYYAGHGFPHEQTKEPYLIPVDASGTDLEFGGIKLTEFYDALTEFPSEKITVFIDACFSGGARNQGLMSARGVKINPKVDAEAIKKKLVVFTASSGSQSSLPFKEMQHGMFTYYLLKKIEETNGKVSYDVLSEYLKSEVSIRSIMINGKEQEPQTNISPEIEKEWKTWHLKE